MWLEWFFGPRQAQQIRLAGEYAKSYRDAGAPGHSQFLIIAMLTAIIEYIWENTTSEQRARIYERVKADPRFTPKDFK